MVPKTTSNCKMLSTQKYISTNIIFALPCVKKNFINGETRFIICMAKKDDFSPKSTPKTPLKKIVSQAAVAVLGLGFIDAGYSGDWSRIGVISTENEDFLKIAAFIVVPLCSFIIISISKLVDD
ncbi:hypothetical protein SSX86_023383 [Deinandra increscens subsp. villosa]|uniref:DUF7887 domain-containing protein n=1 Tax=Deinandra increscens subsp. villosa TaxID=3103831 RepID=A0AAP0CKR5_9ASTR